MKKYFLILLLFVSALTQAQIYSSVPGLKITNDPAQANDTTEVELLGRVITGANEGKVYSLPYSTLAIPRNTSDLVNDGETGVSKYTEIKNTNTVIIDTANVSNVRNDQSSVIKLSNGNLVAVYSHFGANPSDSSTAELWASQSSDDGLTWSDEYLLIDDIELGSYIPSFYKKSNGNILMLFFVRISPVPTSESKLYKIEYNSDMTSIVSAAAEIPMPVGYYPVAADRLFYDEVNDKLLYPYPLMVSGTGQSTESIYESRLLVSDDEGDTWADAGFGVGSELLIYNEYGGASEPGLYYTPESGLVMYFRTVLGQLKATKLTYSAGYSNIGSVFDLHSANNACPAVKYVDGKGLVSLSVRALDFGEPSSRLFMDLWTSVDGINFTRTDFVDFAISPYVVNNPTLYVSEDNNYFMAVYGKTMTNSSWTSLLAKKYSSEVFDYFYSPKYKNGFAEDGRGYVYNGYQIKNRRVSPTYSVKVQNPLGGSFKSENNPETGAIAITLPNNDNTYLTIKGTVYDNTENSSFAFEISCNASDMAKNTVVLKGQRNLSVRFVNASQPKIFIGDLSTTWAYPSVTIDEISAHNDASLLELCEGWVVGIEASSFGTVVSTKTDNTQTTLSNKVTKGGDTGAFSIGNLGANSMSIIYNNSVIASTLSDGLSIINGFNIKNSTPDRFILNVGTNAAAAKITRNTATSVAAFTTENINASSTGDIHNFGNNTGIVAGVRKDGKVYGVNGTASNDFTTKSQLDLKANLDSPSLTGTPTAPNPSAADYSTNIATTKFATDIASFYGTQLETESGATFTITPSRKKVVLVCTGTTITVDFPPILGNEGVEIIIINKGSGDATLASNAGGNDFWDAGSSGSSAVVPTNSTATFINDGTHYSKK